jgi:hypothetical protein
LADLELAANEMADDPFHPFSLTGYKRSVVVLQCHNAEVLRA